MFDDRPFVTCRACSSRYNTVVASVCDCETEQRTLQCPMCDACSCTAVTKPIEDAGLDTLRVRKAVERKLRPLAIVAHPDFETRASAKRSLERAGYGVITVGDGEEAWRLVIEYRPQIVVAGASMPGIDGHSLAMLVRNSSAAEKTRVQVLAKR
ncbi:MAG: hypothetical protein ACXW3E_02610 [Thermoanaerobaculia bacterium]